MRTRSVLTGLAILAPAVTLAGEAPKVELGSRLERVVVYSSGAAVTRAAAGDIPAGRSRLSIAGLPPALEAGTFKARLEAPADARMLSVDYHVEPSVRPGREDEKRLVERLNDLDLRLKEVNDERALLNGKAEFINAVSLTTSPVDGKAIPMAAPKLEPESWTPVLDFSEKELTVVLDRLRELGQSAGALEEEIKSAKEEFRKLRSQTVPAVASAVVEVESPAAGEARLLLTYSVTNAAWYPAYSFIVSPEEGAARMVRYASCAQNTGEDWRDVEMVFSSGEEQRVASLPELKTWLIVERVTGGGIEPPRAGDREPGEEDIERPGDLPAASAVLATNPLAGLGFMGAGRLGEAFGYRGLGSLGRTYEDLKGRTDIPLAGTGIVGSLGGGGAGAYGFRTGGGRKRAALRGGGSRRSEACVDAGLRWLPKHQEADGSWSSRANGGGPRMDEADTALALLSMLGAGHTEKQGKYKGSVARAVSYLRSRQAADGSIGSDLWTRALTTCALSEAYGMCRVPETGRAAQRSANALAREIASAPWPLQPGLTGREWPDGPSNLAFLTLAFKSARVSGLKVQSAAMIQLMSMLDDLETGPPDPLGSAAAMVVRQMLGFKRTDKDVIRNAKTLAANL
ncbi:MAG: mucoidy inhibitor MuiA family protein, partial [Planctomycetota bacterium]